MWRVKPGLHDRGPQRRLRSTQSRLTEVDMLSEQEIKQYLHASRGFPLAVSNPHGPLGLEQLAAEVSRQRTATPASSCQEKRASQVTSQDGPAIHGADPVA